MLKIAFNPPWYSYPAKVNPNKDYPRRIQRDDAIKIIVFHTSTVGVQSHSAHYDIVVNGGNNQPDCFRFKIPISIYSCSHESAFNLYVLIAHTGTFTFETYLDPDSIERSLNHHPLVYNTEACTDPKKRNDKCTHFEIKITEPPTIMPLGTYYMRTGKLIKKSKKNSATDNEIENANHCSFSMELVRASQENMSS